MNALQLRVAAAVGLVADGVLDGELALSLAVWPPTKLEELTESADCPDGRSRWTEEHRRRAYELADAGLSQREIAVEVCGDARLSRADPLTLL